jgi:hypothetical protein
MLGEGMIKDLTATFLERMRELESIKGPYAVNGFSLLKIAAIGERAKHGVPLMEPYGTTRKLPSFEELFFIPAMINMLPVDPKQVNTKNYYRTKG